MIDAMDPQIPLSVEKQGLDSVRVRVDLSAFRPTARVEGREWWDSVSLRLQGGEVQTSRHGFDDLWWSNVLNGASPPTNEYDLPLFPSTMDPETVIATWRAMYAAVLPYIDLRAQRLARVAGNVQRLYEVLAFESVLQDMVSRFRPAGPLLAYHRTFRIRAGETLDTAFARLVRETNPVVRSYIPMIVEVEAPLTLSPFFMEWARRVRLTPRHQTLNAPGGTMLPELIYQMLLASPTLDPSSLNRLRTPTQWGAFHEAVARGSGLASAVLADPVAAVRAINDFGRGSDADWNMMAAGFLGAVEGAIQRAGATPNPRTLEEWGRVLSE